MPRLKTAFEQPQAENVFYVGVIERILKNALPPDLFRQPSAKERLDALLPIFTWTPFQTPPYDHTFFLFCHFRPNSFRFFHEMVTRWLIPGKRFNSLVQLAVDFSIPELGDGMYIAGEVMIRIENERELEIIQKNLPIVETEARLGIVSQYQANRILEIKGITADEKTALIQENIASLIKRRPQDFDYDIFSEMQHFLVLCKDEFKQSHTYRHMNRILCTHYLFRKALQATLESFPERRYVSAKLIRALLDKKPILGVVIAVSFLHESEVFDEKQILGALLAHLPGLKVVEGSFFFHAPRSNPVRTYYLEVMKEEGSHFTGDEIRLLKAELPSELKNRIEKRLSPLFMPENEEEVMRHILVLSQEVKFVRDLPQAVINFHKQTEEKLEFSVIMVRAVTPLCAPIAELFVKNRTLLDFIPKRSKIIGKLRNRYEKEATVFRLKIAKAPFLRQDGSVDLYKARQEIALELSRVIGEFRDYNGGTLSKETEILNMLRSLSGRQGEQHTFLLEDFFYSLTPPIMRSVLPAEPLSALFFMLLSAKERGLPDTQYFLYHTQYDEAYGYIVIVLRDTSYRGVLQEAIENLKLPPLQLTSCFVHTTDAPCFGVVYRREGEIKEEVIRDALEECLHVAL